jgi:N-acetylmuramoyl-L-alanine amidase
MFIFTAPTSLLSGASQRMNHHARNNEDSFISKHNDAGKSGRCGFRTYYYA